MDSIIVEQIKRARQWSGNIRITSTVDDGIHVEVYDEHLDPDVYTSDWPPPVIEHVCSEDEPENLADTIVAAVEEYVAHAKKDVEATAASLKTETDTFIREYDGLGDDDEDCPKCGAEYVDDACPYCDKDEYEDDDD